MKHLTMVLKGGGEKGQDRSPGHDYNVLRLRLRLLQRHPHVCEEPAQYVVSDGPRSRRALRAESGRSQMTGACPTQTHSLMAASLP